MWHSDKYLLRWFLFPCNIICQTDIESPEVGWVPQIVGSLTSPSDFVLGISVAPQYPSCQDSQPSQILGSLPLGCGGDAGDAAPGVAVGCTQPWCHHCTAKCCTERWQHWGTRSCCSNGSSISWRSLGRWGERGTQGHMVSVGPLSDLLLPKASQSYKIPGQVDE